MEDKTELNRTHFDNEAADYDLKHEKASAEIVKRVQARRDFIGVQWIEDDDDDDDDDDEDDEIPDEEESTRGKKEPTSEAARRSVRLLDYACGTGAMSRALAPYTTQCVGIDLSEKMVAAYNTRAQNQGLSEDEMVAYHGNICLPAGENPDAFQDATRFFNFDLACVGLGFHHFDDPGLAAKRLVQRLKPGGVLVIIDFFPHAGGHDQHHHHDADDSDGHPGHSQVGAATSQGHGPHEAMKTVTHHGFSEESIKSIFVAAGAGQDFAIDNMGEVIMGAHMGKRTLFMARGTKAQAQA